MFEGHQLVSAQLLADADGIVPGHPVTIGLRASIRARLAHLLAIRRRRRLPHPHRLDPAARLHRRRNPMAAPRPITEPGDIVTYDYPGDVLLPVEIQAPGDLQPGQTVEIRAHASWLVCREICVPGKADLSLTLPVVASSHPANEELFRQTRALLPWTGVSAVYRLVGAPGADPRPDPRRDSIPQRSWSFSPSPATSRSATPRSPRRRSESRSSIPRRPPIPSTASSSSKRALPAKSGSFQPNPPPPGARVMLLHLHTSAFILRLLYWLGLGFLGGLILNVMPCVLPVIALKIFGFIKQAGESPRRILALGFTFVAGIFAWFLFLAALIVGFKLAGPSTQLGLPVPASGFVAVMVVILLLFSLNLLGVFEIVLPGPHPVHGPGAAGQEGYAGTFWHGVFATLMATPCTAPFLGPALGFALAQPAPTVFAMFGSIAAGMSAPYAILAVRPGWLRYLPKPGIWMVRVKQALGILLLGTVLWLGWVLYRSIRQSPRALPARASPTPWPRHKIVFVDFTADWCVNCKVNERLVLDSGPVQDAFRQHDVILLKADWTNGDEDITALLRKFGRAGVPCYVVYPPRRPADRPARRSSPRRSSSTPLTRPAG